MQWPLIDQLVCQGVRDFFLAPGSRSTPLAVAVSRHPKARLHRHFDERGLGFYAMGYGLGSGFPAALIVTSGTAVGNLAPAVMEAHHASVPLIVLTADRPPELREASANQTTDQIKMFQNFVRWQFDLDPHMPEAAIRSKAAQAVFRARYPHPGPVHINCPCREPLYPAAQEGLGGSEKIVIGKPIQLEASGSDLLPLRTLPSRGIILLGRCPNGSDAKTVLELAEKLGWPVFADIFSNARLEKSANLIRHYDWLFWGDLPRPDCILHFGERLTSKRLMQWLAASPPTQMIHISPHLHWCDPSSLITDRILSEIKPACRAFENKLDPSWLAFWQEKEQTIRFEDSAVFTETTAIRMLNKMPLASWAIFLANSMPIREADWFLFPEEARGFFGNRGLSGIDGNIATVAGLSIGHESPVLAILGDMTTLHDLNSISLLKNAPYPIVLLVSNNNGCGIFSHLPMASDPAFEALWGFPHGLEFEFAARLFQLPYASASDAASFESVLQSALQANQSSIVEMKTSREHNHAYHQKMQQDCQVTERVSTNL